MSNGLYLLHGINWLENFIRVASVYHKLTLSSISHLRVLGTGYAGCVHFQGSTNCEIKVLILLYSTDKKAYLGFIPNEQAQFVGRWEGI